MKKTTALLAGWILLAIVPLCRGGNGAPPPTIIIYENGTDSGNAKDTCPSSKSGCLLRLKDSCRELMSLIPTGNASDESACGPKTKTRRCLEWLTYHPAHSCGLHCTCCRTYPCGLPPLYTFFLCCDSNGTIPRVAEECDTGERTKCKACHGLKCKHAADCECENCKRSKRKSTADCKCAACGGSPDGGK
jgi:hypothetical protein